MNKRLVILIFVGMIFLAGGVSAKEEIFSVSVEYHSGNVSIVDAYATNTTYFEKDSSGDYSLKVLDVGGEELYVRNFDFILEYAQGPPIEGEDFEEEIFTAEDAEELLIVPYFDVAENMEVYFGGDKVAEKYVGYLTGSCGDGICKPHEKARGCAVDCVEKSGKDSFSWRFFVLAFVIVVTVVVAGWLIRNVMKEGLKPKLG